MWNNVITTQINTEIKSQKHIMPGLLFLALNLSFATPIQPHQMGFLSSLENKNCGTAWHYLSWQYQTHDDPASRMNMFDMGLCLDLLAKYVHVS